jgi:hypothetical protein
MSETAIAACYVIGIGGGLTLLVILIEWLKDRKRR